jgi:hypothetical protein
LIAEPHTLTHVAIGKRPVVRRELAMSVEKHFTHDYITSHTMKSYHHTIVFYIRENYDDANRIEP